MTRFPSPPFQPIVQPQGHRGKNAMAIVRTIFWVLVAVALVLFAINNWQPVEVRVWATQVLET